jgi:hypothetical protein
MMCVCVCVRAGAINHFPLENNGCSFHKGILQMGLVFNGNADMSYGSRLVIRAEFIKYTSQRTE